MLYILLPARFWWRAVGVQLDYLTIIAPKCCITFNSEANDGTTIAHNTCVTIVVQSEGRPISVTQTKSPIQIINYLPTHSLSYPPSNLNFHQLQLLHHPLPVHSVRTSSRSNIFKTFILKAQMLWFSRQKSACWLLWPHLCIKLSPNEPKFLSHILGCGPNLKIV